jgi:hypothetical protein
MASIGKQKSGNYQLQIRLQGLRAIALSLSARKMKSQEFVRLGEGDSGIAPYYHVPMILLTSDFCAVLFPVSRRIF